jgi:hypothetical protein
MSQGHLWYVKRGSVVTGPFPIALIERNIASGRLRADDLLSNDGEHWTTAGNTPAFADIVIGRQRRAGRARFDERQRDRRSDHSGEGGDIAESRSTKDRRRSEPSDIVKRRERSQRVWRSIRADRLDHRGPIIAIVVGLFVIATIGVLLRAPQPASAPDCSSQPQPEVNWDFCQKPHVDLKQVDLRGISARNSRLSGSNLAGANLADADLAYADLGTAVMQLADLSRARLIGANLRAANLSYANLQSADLQFVDLRDADLQGANFRQARLSNAIWSDGRQCARHSIGECIAAAPDSHARPR